MVFEVDPHHSAYGATDMSILTNYVGLDYHQDSVRVCVVNEAGKELCNRDCPNDVEYVGELIWQFGPPRTCAIEACCGAADFAERLQQRYAFDVRLAHPGYVRKLKQSPDKTDRGDAFLLADLARVDYLPEVWLAPAATRQLRRLVRFRQQLKRARTEVKQQLRGLLREERVQGAPANPWTKGWLAWLREAASLGPEARWVLERQLQRLESLNQEIAVVDQRLADITADDPLTQQLLDQTGVGLVTAVTLRAEIGSFRRFRNGKQLARFCGVTPCNASSGKQQADAGLVRASNRELRTVVLETAHRLARYDQHWGQLKQRLRRSKPGSVAAAAVANRWVRRLHHQMLLAENAAETPARALQQQGSPTSYQT
jgi:transposase